MAARLDLAALEALVAVADHGSIAAAARAVGMAQPNVSVSIARLERRVGTQLLHRSTTGATPTPAGLLVIEWIRPVLAAARVLDDGIVTLSDTRATLSLAASQTIAENLVPGWITRLRIAHPELGITIAVCNSAEVLDRVRAGQCDLGFIEEPASPRGLRSRTVGEDELVLIAPPTHPLTRRRKPLPLAELANLPLVARESGSGTRTTLDHALREHGLPAVEPVQVAASNATVRVAVLSGAGLAVISRRAVQTALADRHLVAVPLDPPVGRPLRAVWAGPARPSSLIADLIRIATTPPQSRRGTPAGD